MKEVRFGIQPRLFLRRKKRLIRRTRVYMGKRILAELARIADGRASGGAVPGQQKKQDRKQQAKCAAFLFPMICPTK